MSSLSPHVFDRQIGQAERCLPTAVLTISRCSGESGTTRVIYRTERSGSRKTGYHRGVPNLTTTGKCVRWQFALIRSRQPTHHAG